MTSKIKWHFLNGIFKNLVINYDFSKQLHEIKRQQNHTSAKKPKNKLQQLFMDLQYSFEIVTRIMILYNAMPKGVKG